MESRKIVIYSGNILNKALSLRKGNKSNDDELFEGLKGGVGQKVDLFNKSEEPQNGNALEICAEEETNSSHALGDRQDLKVTLKLFLYSLERQDILDAIERGLRSTSVDYLDNVILSFSGYSKSGALTLEHIEKAWVVLEDQINAGKSNGSATESPCLYDLAFVKPGIVQINLATCSVVPPELAAFCKEKSIQLLTHSDPLNILPEEKVSELGNVLIEHADPARQLCSWDIEWVMRLQVHLKTRGVLATKGYVASLIGKNL